MRSSRLSACGVIAVVLSAGCSVTPQPEGPTQRHGNFAVIDGNIASVPKIRMGHPAVVRRLVRMGRQDNHVMDNLTTLTQEFGPRLTGSSNAENAARWARDRFDAWGLHDARLAEWGEIAVRFDRGPSTGAVYAPGRRGELEKARDLQFTTLSWTPGTNGPERGPVVRMPQTTAELDAVRDQLAGAWILVPDEQPEGRGGVRSVGFLMRERIKQRHEIRNPNVTAEDESPHGGAEPTSAEETPHGAHWSGTYDYSGNKIPCWVQTSDLNADPITGTLSIPGFSTGPISEPAYDADTHVLTFTWKHAMGASHITLTIDGQTAKGESKSGSGNIYPIELTWKDAAEQAAEETEEATEDATKLAILTAVLDANPLGFISSSRDPERVWTTSKTGWRDMPLADYETDVEVNITGNDYDYLNSRLADGIPVQVEFDLQRTLTAGPIPCYNVIAEIPGTELPDEVVIVSAHLDSWDGPGSQGCTDNGTGSSVVLEAARLLAKANVEPKRTIRFILWSGEEQGLLGSKAYVESLSEDELAKISAAFVDDGGTNYEGGLPAADCMIPYLAAATAPVNGYFFSRPDYDSAMHDDDADNDKWAGYMNVNIHSTGEKIKAGGGSDHASFNKLGVPGFFWDEVGRAEYRRGWHTQFDRLDLAIPEYLRQSATTMAVTAYQLACAPTRLPRTQDELDKALNPEPKPEPTPKKHTKPTAPTTTEDAVTIEPLPAAG
ncbi:MAG: M20/M25/M40 family metallo-hydrolase [Phycisphaerales bacterium]